MVQEPVEQVLVEQVMFPPWWYHYLYEIVYAQTCNSSY